MVRQIGVSVARTYVWHTRSESRLVLGGSLDSSSVTVLEAAELPAGSTIERTLLWADASWQLGSPSGPAASLQVAVGLGVPPVSDPWASTPILSGIDVLGVGQISMMPRIAADGDETAETAAGTWTGLDARAARTVDGSVELVTTARLAGVIVVSTGAWTWTWLARVLVLTPDS